ncbi:hypothetical protein M3175_20870 [Robertmurraya korlensis]|uniref:hypothetical protein n=1 Tax=Robertmurraya korlensis TaxID=519977 RepID=UPI00203FE162|nr:hypothetical protein [Robertmurraya korlensis]MCM3603195.1 hypothetical protein [Robertmurraya korlensis]
MPNCDFGGPCDCLDCRTDQFSVKCPHCEFSNDLTVVGHASYTRDKKGTSGYVFSYPTRTKDLICYSCSKVIPGVRYYDSYNETMCQRNLKIEQDKLNGFTCSSCDATEGELKGPLIGGFIVKLIKYENKLYCESCIVDIGRKKIPDPSNNNEKYIFNGKTLKWELYKVKISCPSCHKNRWLNAENRWKTMCKKCYLNL